MAKHYRVVHHRSSWWEAIRLGRISLDCYNAQARTWWGWRTIGTHPTIGEAEATCRDHAGGMLLPGGDKIVSEFVRPE